jgi:hypothetical protein
MRSESAGYEDDRLLQAVREYQVALEAGEAPDRRAFLDRHADIAASLADCLDGLDLVRAAAPGLRNPFAVPPPLPPTAPAEFGQPLVPRPPNVGRLASDCS